MGLNKRNENYKKKQENNQTQGKTEPNENPDDNKSDLEDEFIDMQSLNMGLEEETFGLFKKRINLHKQNKGHGFLISYNKDNEDKRIDKLIKAMKLGLRVVLVSDAGTPTISDPGNFN